MKTVTTKIGAYEVALAVYPDGSQCDVSLETTAGRFFGSLAMLDQEEVLYNHLDHHTSVPRDTIDKIVAWAEQNGY